jgi:hypothetical protein
MTSRTSRPTRTPDLHELQTYTTSRPLHLLHTRHIHKHNQAGREEKPGTAMAGRIASISKMVGKS